MNGASHSTAAGPLLNGSTNSAVFITHYCLVPFHRGHSHLPSPSERGLSTIHALSWEIFEGNITELNMGQIFKGTGSAEVYIKAAIVKTCIFDNGPNGYV